MYQKYSQQDLAELGQGQSVGVCHNMIAPNIINYLAGYIVNDVDKAKNMGLDILEVEASDYAIMELGGCVPECIHEGWKYAREVFYPETGYVHSGKPDFEYYYEGDMASQDYQMELWILIRKA